MAKTNWKKLQAQFEVAHDKYGTSPKDWCESKGLNYQTARRYIKLRKNAQSENAQTAQSRSAQSGKAIKSQNKSKSETKKDLKSDPKKENNNNSASTDADLKNHNTDGRDERGWFKPGNQIAVGNSGNPDPSYSFEEGNQLRKRSGVYSRLLTENKKEMHEYSKIAVLEDELDITRTRLQSGIEFIERVTEDISNADDQKSRIALYEIYQKTEMRMDVLTARIESISKTLSSLGIDIVNKEKIIQDTKRIKAAERKLRLEADKLQNEGQGDDTPIASIVSEIQSMNKSGLMSE